MKKLLCLIFCALLITSPAPAGISTGGGGTSGSGSYFGTTTERGINKEVWVAVRTDSLAGTGTAEDPFDGSTATKFDALMVSIPVSTKIHLGPGTFLTVGTQVKNHWWIDGAGKSLTTIRLADGTASFNDPAGQAFVLYNLDFQTLLDSFRVSNLTLDANRAGQVTYTSTFQGALNAMVVYTKLGRAENVSATGIYVNPGEGFPFSFQGPAASTDGTTRHEIDKCEVTDAIGNLSAITSMSQGSGVTSGYIKNCSVSGASLAVAYGSGGWKHFEFTNNRAQGCVSGLVIDTGVYDDVLIQGNQLNGCVTYGMLLNGTSYNRVLIQGNTVDVAATGGGCVYLTTGEYTVQGNRFSSLNGAVVSVAAGTKGILSNNIITETSSSNVSAASGLKTKDNFTELGVSVSLGITSYTANSIPRREGTNGWSLQGSTIIIDDSNRLLGPINIGAVSGGSDYATRVSGVRFTRSDLPTSYYNEIQNSWSGATSDNTMTFVVSNGSGTGQPILRLDGNLGATFFGSVSIPDNSYAAGWNGSTDAPTKNAVYDKIEEVAVPTYNTAPAGVLFRYKVTGVDLETVAATTAFTVPTGKTFIPIKADFVSTAGDSVSVTNPVMSLQDGSANPISNSVSPTAANASTVGHTWGITGVSSTGSTITVPAGGTVKVAVTTATTDATSACTADVSILGYYL